MNIFTENQPFNHGVITYKAGGRFGPREQKGLQLVYIFEGEALISVDGETRYLGPGEATLLLPGHREVFLFSSTQATQHGWCTLLDPQLSPATQTALETLPFRTSFSKSMRDLDRMIRSLKKKTRPGGETLIRSLMQSLFYQFFYETGISGESRTHPLHPAVQRACTYIDANFQAPLDLKTIAANCGVTAAHLSRLFKEQLQRTATGHLWKVRVTAAADLLTQTGLSSAEIAYKTGFANPAHFSRLFKEHYTLPPGKYRNVMWGQYGM
jgi:AraC-like DNA-binding protein